MENVVYYLHLIIWVCFMDDLWQNILAHLKTTLSSASFNIWFAKTKQLDVQKDGGGIHLLISCPSSFVQDTIEKRFLGQLQKIGQELTSNQVTFSFQVRADRPPINNNLFRPLHLETPPPHPSSHPQLNPAYTFQNFVVGPSNQVAVAAAQSIANSPGSIYNPFFLFGDVGLGKTHLIQAIAHQLIANNPRTKILYTTSEEFTNDLIRGLRNQKMEFYKNKYRKIDVLLIDDIQFIAEKTFVQEEFFHTFNSLYMAGKQVIVTADSPPDEISGMPQRIISRFKGGLTIDIQPLDYETRRGILEYKIGELQLVLDSEIIDWLNNYPFKNAREIEGILLKLKTLSSLQHQQITLTTLNQMLGKNHLAAPSFTPKEVIKTTASFWGIKMKDILGKGRQSKIATARQVAMYLCRQELNLPYTQIGRIFGGKDHSTVIHSVEKINQLFKTDNQIRQAIISIKSNLLK